MSALQVVTILLRVLLQSRAALAAENLALRQQVALLQRSVKRPKLHPRDRIFWVWLSLFNTQYSCLRGTSQLPRVPMVQPTDTGNSEDLPHSPRLDRALLGSVLPEPEMCSVLAIMTSVCRTSFFN